MSKGITFRGKHSYRDLGLIMEFFEDLGANQKAIRDEVPFMNGSYDFSTVGSMGENVYTNRTMRARFGYKALNKAALRNKYDQIIDWLMDGPITELIDDDQPDLLYMAKVEQYPSKEEFLRIGKFTVIFTGDSFKKGVEYEGDKLWDTFHFEFDYLQDTEFDVVGSKVVKIYNPGRVVVPTVNCSSSMTAQLNGYTSNFIDGDNKDYRFRLLKGENTITITGTGHVKILFRKELL